MPAGQLPTGSALSAIQFWRHALINGAMIYSLTSKQRGLGSISAILMQLSLDEMTKLLPMCLLLLFCMAIRMKRLH
ncbi:hypothetical protein PROAA_910008 [Candidatus Propionivibrio aalborgensis]|uniref:Uncharacterized protein n=1 Tax=Candidatus Propionivibrio aalborgensis TaxID=1860101 RepID=A0A1A8Y2C4_9RHOO|nr:hypothetical protein PROAA_910008 [Candidatus Propionivibrio aalborgensis]